MMLGVREKSSRLRRKLQSSSTEGLREACFGAYHGPQGCVSGSHPDLDSDLGV